MPKKVVEVKGDMALMQDGRWVSLKLVEGVSANDMLLVQANIAVEKVSHKASKHMKRTLQDGD